MSVLGRWVIAGAATAVLAVAAVAAVQSSQTGTQAAGRAPAPAQTAPANAGSTAVASPNPSDAPSASAQPADQPDDSLRPATRPLDTRKGKQLGTPFTVDGIQVVSAKHRVKASFKPAISSRYPLTPAAAKAFARLSAAVHKAGLRLFVVSGFRSHASQAALYRHALAAYGRAYTTRYVAVPGTSEHQTGLAVDLRSRSGRGTNFDRSREWRWLRAHAQNYGFVLRYPNGLTKVTGIGFEPWHWRYVGVAQAKAIRALGPNTTIEQYLRLA